MLDPALVCACLAVAGEYPGEEHSRFEVTLPPDMGQVNDVDASGAHLPQLFLWPSRIGAV
jgi:hypothetical protein